jgi:bifunctional pyridoxal-dependent enzyme with beta-cystathionase and maltose regulon repressor activities
MEERKVPIYVPFLDKTQEGMISEKTRKKIRKFKEIAEKVIEEMKQSMKRTFIFYADVNPEGFSIEVEQAIFTDKDVETITKIAKKHKLTVKFIVKPYCDAIHGGVNIEYLFHGGR